MNISQVQNEIAAIDKAMLAVKYMVTPRYVEQLLLGQKPAKTKQAKNIIAEYEQLEQDNYTWLMEVAQKEGLEIHYDD